MNALQLNRMEEILTIPNDTQRVIIGSDEVLYFLYYNSTFEKNHTEINVSEVRKKYIETLYKSYIESENYVKKNDIVFDLDDIVKIKTKS